METQTELTVRRLGRRDYRPVWDAMRAFSAARAPDQRDALWLVEHPPVFTLGLNAKHTHLRDPGAIPVVRTDRGGQVTYHGPGQLVVYTLLDLGRRGWGVRQLVNTLEQAVIELLAELGIAGRARREAPGVYVGDAKIAALGLRVRRGRSYHGLSLNVAMDLEPFRRIDPCGLRGLEVTQLSDLGGPADLDAVATLLQAQMVRLLGYPAAARPPELTPAQLACRGDC